MSTEAMRTGWGTMSDKHVNEIVTGCDGLAGALEAAAGCEHSSASCASMPSRCGTYEG